ncbi:MAG: LysR family transcriptional regulator [Clostridiales bacterium]|nr:LysR family transcriptional regulator [Clostridiales bacterium]
MSLYSYKVFLEVVDSGSFVKASEKLNLSPSAVSHAVKSLENEFGFSLLSRNRAGASVTSSGKRVLPYIRSLIKIQNNLEQEVNIINNYDVGAVRIGLFSSVASNWFIKILHDFKENNPGVDVIFQQGDYADIMTWLKNGDVDMAFTTDELAKDTNFLPLREDPLICVTSEEYVPSDGKQMAPSDLKGSSLIINKECEQYDARSYLKENGIHADAYYETVTHQTLFAMVREGMGICLIPELVANVAREGVRKYPIKGRPSRIIGLTYSDPETISPAAKLLTEAIKKYVDQL